MHGAKSVRVNFKNQKLQIFLQKSKQASADCQRVSTQQANKKMIPTFYAKTDTNYLDCF